MEVHYKLSGESKVFKLDKNNNIIAEAIIGSNMITNTILFMKELESLEAPTTSITVCDMPTNIFVHITDDSIRILTEEVDIAPPFFCDGPNKLPNDVKSELENIVNLIS